MGSKNNTKGKNRLHYFLAGGIAGSISRTIIAPMERIKIVYQVNRSNLSTTSQGRGGWSELIPQIVRKEGLKSFWKGNSAAVARVVPYMSCTFVSFEEYKHILTSSSIILSKNSVNFVAGTLAGITAVCATYPLDTVRARMAMQDASGHAKYNSMMHALRTIPQQEGFLRLYRGMGATITGVGPYAGIKFWCYEMLKSQFCEYYHTTEKELPAYVRVGSGSVAGMVAMTFCYPVDVIRRRQQTHSGAKPLYNGVWDALKNIYLKEGVSRGLYRGVTLNYVKTMPNVAIYMSIYDVIKHFLESQQL